MQQQPEATAELKTEISSPQSLDSHALVQSMQGPLPRPAGQLFDLTIGSSDLFGEIGGVVLHVLLRQ